MRTVLEILAFGLASAWLLGLIPAALVSILKGRLLFFAVGWILFGITWFIGALALAEPGSWWARRFYGEGRAARAADPIRHRRPARVTALWLGGGIAAVLLLGLLTARPTPLTGVDGEALQFSVGGALGPSSEPCVHLADGSWRCHAYDREVSSGVPYTVRTHGLGCWTAVPSGPGGESVARRRSGCVTIVDEILG